VVCRLHLDPFDFIARLAALVPKPRVNLMRFHRAFAPNSKPRARVTSAKRGRGGERLAQGDPDEPTLAERRAAMSWSQRLKRVFGIDIETCPVCGGSVGIIYASRILRSLKRSSRTRMRKELSPKPPCGHRAGRHRSGGCSRRGDDPTMTFLGLRHWQRGHGGG